MKQITKYCRHLVIIPSILVMSGCNMDCISGCKSSFEQGSSFYPQKFPLKGCTLTDYSVSATVGGIPEIQLIVDSGSTDLAVASSICTNCTGVSPIYDASHGTNQSSAIIDTYGSGTIRGDLYLDSVAIGNVPSIETVFSAMTSQTSFFTTSACDLSTSGINKDQGIMGVAFSALATISNGGYLDQLVAAQPTFPNTFAVQLCQNGGNLWLGGFDSSSMTSSPQYTPIVTDKYYSVSVSDIQIGGTTLGLPSSDYETPIVDTGTSITQLPSAVYNAITSTIGANSVFQSNFGGASFFNLGSCYSSSLSSEQLDAQLPTLGINFASTTSGQTFTIVLPATKSYLDMVTDTSGQQLYCSGVATSSQAVPIIGGSFLRSLITVFDRVNGRVGFAPQTGCSS